MTDDIDDTPAMTETAARLQAKLWNLVPSMPYPDRAKAESIASADEWTPGQRRAAYALVRKYSPKG
jgi:hypothetical protein